MLIKNKNYILCFTSILLLFGTLTSIFITLTYQLNPYGFSNQAAYIILISNSFGLIGCVLGGLYIKKTKKYKKTVILCGYVGSISFAMILLLQNFLTNALFIYIFSALGGIALFPYITTMIELSTEISFPVG